MLAAMKSFESVFKSAYPYHAPFRPHLEERVILAPVLDQFNREQLVALAAAAPKVGDSRFYFAVAGTYPDSINAHWPHRELSDLLLIAFDDYDSYSATSEFTTNALWSPGGRWGVVVSHEWFAVVAGCTSFMHVLAEKYPSVPRNDDRPPVAFKDQVALLIEDVKSWKDQAWLSRLLTHVYGRTHANQLLQEHDLGELIT